MPEEVDKEIRKDKPAKKVKKQNTPKVEEMDKEIRKDKPVHHTVDHVDLTAPEESTLRKVQRPSDVRPGANPFLQTNE